MVKERKLPANFKILPDCVDTRGLLPRQADVFIAEFYLQKEDETSVYIEIYHIENLGVEEFCPTIVKMITGEKHEELDVFIINNEGQVLEHTNQRYENNGKELITQDRSLNNLFPFKGDILNQDKTQIIYTAKARLERAFAQAENR